MNKKSLTLLLIIIAGETIFMLPFLIPRLYRPLMLEAWNITNTDIGTAFSAYGFSAMISYMVGGPLADKYSPRLLMAISLLVTSFLGLGLVLFPSPVTLIAVYFSFGVSTIFLMWGALIKVTHIAGGEDNRSTAMGILDSGRGLVAAIMSSVLVFIVALVFSEEALQENKVSALNIIYISTIIFTFFVSVAIWLGLRGFSQSENAREVWSVQKSMVVLKDSKVWLLGIVVLSSYCGYKSIGNYSVYLVDVQKLSIAKSSMFTSVIFWLRPISALAAGVIADKIHMKFRSGRFITLFILLALGSLFQLLLAFKIFSHFSFIFGVILFSAIFTYALRSVYFSVFGDLKIKEYLVGTTVGIVSFVGFLPDMFFGIITGRLIDSNPGELGYIHTFFFTAAFLLIGSVAGFILYRKSSNK